MVRPPTTSPLPFPHPLPSPPSSSFLLLKFTHLHCPDQCQPVHIRLLRRNNNSPYMRCRTVDQLRAAMYHRAGAVLRDVLHPPSEEDDGDATLEVDAQAVRLYITCKNRNNGSAKSYSLGDMADKKKRDQVMAELGKGGENMMLEVKFTTRENNKKKAKKAPEPPTEVVWDNQKGKGKAVE